MLRVRTLAQLVAIASTAIACTQPGQPAALARADHALFWSDAGVEETLWIGSGGGFWQHGELDKNTYPALFEAWQLGQTPRVPLYGRDPGLQLRALTAYPPARAGDAWRLQAKALSSHPIRLTLLADRGGVLTPIGSVESEMWNRRSHFARVDASAGLQDGSLVAIRVEGAYQAFESLLRLYAAP